MNNNYKVIGIAGPARVGKDTAADYLLEHLPMGYVKYSFADPIKAMLLGLDLTYEQLHGNLKDVVDERFDCTPRRMMQTLGTEWGREHVHPLIWIRAMDSLITNQAVIPDVRFENEADYIRENGILIHIVKNYDSMAERHQHVSENGIKVDTRDLVVRNRGTLEEYRTYLAEVLKYL
jgi:hypothetical protein